MGTRESRVTKLLTILPRRGPNAFTIFRNLLRNDYDWIVKELDDALKYQVKKASEEDTHKNLTRVVNKQLVPLVFSENFNYADPRDHISQTIIKVGYLATMLENKVYKALDLPEKPKKKLSVDKLITEKLREDRSVESLTKEIQDLKKRLKQEEKLRKENEELKTRIENNKKTVREHQKQIKECRNENKLLKKKHDKVLKEKEVLEGENKSMKKELESVTSGCEIKEMFQ